jgi:two-component system chemotaxis response regulator CheY
MARVLVVDDAGFMRQTLSAILQQHGHTVVGTAADGSEAVTAYQQHKPDLVTMDLTMPNVDGLQAVREIREIGPKARIVVVSAMGQQAKVLDAIQAGASDFVVKPFDEERLIMAVTVALKRKG